MLDNALLEVVILRNKLPVFKSVSSLPFGVIDPLNISIDSFASNIAVKSVHCVPFNAVPSLRVASFYCLEENQD